MADHRSTENRDPDKRVVVNATEARQGSKGKPVLYVLIFALALAVVAWVSAEFWGTSINTQTRPDTSASSQTSPSPAGTQDNLVDDNPLPGEKREKEPAQIDPQPTGNQ